MISFSCPCGHYKFSLPDDMAGGLIQCPKCRRLNDVPTSGDLASIDEDGAYKLYDEPTIPTNLGTTGRAFTRSHLDSHGNEIDFRNLDRDYSKIGVGAERIAVNDDAISFEDPKYDPLTGELLRPVTVKAIDDSNRPKIDPATLPMAKAPSKIAAESDRRPSAKDAWLIPMNLLSPMNLFVMAIILATHLFSQVLLVLIGFGFLLVGFFFPVLQLLFLSHFGNVIDETGPTRNNELPAPLRSLSFSDDTFGPMLRMVLALLISYAPAIGIAMSDNLPVSLRWTAAAIFGLIGSLFAPAAMLTSCTSGTWINLRPDRILSVIARSGGEYVLPALLWLIAAPLYLLAATVLYIKTLGGAMAMLFGAMELPDALQFMIRLNKSLSSTHGSQWLSWTMVYIALAGAIFAMHWMCWSLGLLYRRHHEQFAWLFQRHERDPHKLAAEGLTPAARGFAVAPKSATAPVAAAAPAADPLAALADAAARRKPGKSR